MKISTAFSQQLGVNSMLTQQAKVLHSQLQLAKGTKILIPSDDPFAASQVIAFQQRIDQVGQYQRNIDTAKQRLGQEESTLQSAKDVMSRLKDLGIQSLNGINNASDKKAIAAEFDQLNAQLLSLANTQRPNGEYLFSGFQTNQAPFTVGTPYTYNGDNNQRKIQISDTRKIADGDPGNSIFGPTSSSAGDSVFDVIKQFSTELNAGNPQASTLGKLDKTFNNIIATRSTVGARLKAIDFQSQSHDGYLLDLRSALSDTQDLDYAKAISQFNLENTALQASQQAFARVQKLSLFNFL